jgi:hypothetical protein
VGGGGLHCPLGIIRGKAMRKHYGSESYLRLAVVMGLLRSCIAPSLCQAAGPDAVCAPAFHSPQISLRAAATLTANDGAQVAVNTHSMAQMKLAGGRCVHSTAGSRMWTT